MKVVDLETFAVANPPPSFGGRHFVFVVLRTDSGITGVGEAYVAPFGPSVVTRMITDVAERHLVGEDPFHIESFWRRAYTGGYGGRPDPSLVGVISALEMACWDIVGKETGRPVHDLLGGRIHEALRAYTYLYPRPGDTTDVYSDPDLAASRAADELARGFTGVKFDPAGPYTAFDGRQPSLARLDLSERFVAALRSAVGDRADLLFGTHGQFTPSGALRLARRLEPFDPLWFEEPVPPADPDQMAWVARRTSVPIATGERLTTKDEFAAVLRAGAAAIVQPNLGRAGGLLEGKKIAALAEVHGAQLAPHLYCGPVVAAANAALAAASPNFLILETIGIMDGFHAELLEAPLQVEDGHLVVSDEPGLGVVLDEDVARAHAVDPADDGLHLDVSGDPAGPDD